VTAAELIKQLERFTPDTEVILGPTDLFDHEEGDWKSGPVTQVSGVQFVGLKTEDPLSDEPACLILWSDDTRRING